MLSQPAVSAGSYYADSIEGPGRWLGAGAAFRDLDGAVGRDEFQRVLEGRHPATGERLVTAQGSSQRGHLSVGTVARTDESGVALYTVRDVARLLGTTPADIEELIDNGSDGSDRGADDLDWISTTSHPVDGVDFDHEVSRHLDLAACPIDVGALRSAGPPDDEVSVTEAARALRVTPRYVRRLCAAFGDPGSGRASRATLASRRDTSGAFRIRRGDLADFAEKRRVPVARVGFDLTLTAEKSISLLAMLTTGERHDQVVDAFTKANDTAIGYLDKHAAVARCRGDSIGTEGLIVASYLHGTSRALDPHPHHHNVVANAIVDENGGVRTLDARALYRHAPAAGALATASMRWELRDLGLAWWRRNDGVWEIGGIDEPVIREFSQRRAEMDEVRRALEDRLGRTISNREEDHVALNTRSDKQGVDPIALREEWLTRADRVGLDIGSCFDRADRALAFETLPDEVQDTMFADLVDPAEGLCARSNTFGRADVMRAISDWSVVDDARRRRKVIVPPAEVERLTARFCATDLVVEIDDATGVIRGRDGQVVRDGQGEPTFTTMELLDVQSRIVTVVGAGASADAGTVDRPIIDAAIASAGQLSGEQEQLVTGWLTSGDRVQCAVGRAGTGKTTTMRVAARAWTDAGYRVLGAAVKGEAARQLADDAGIESDTVAMLLARSNGSVGVLDARTVLVVDEASTIGDRDLLRLCDLAEATGATLRLIGDTAQHGSVPAGGSFAGLVDLYAERTPQLETVRRLTDAGERRRADLVRNGRIDTALDELQASDQLVLTESDNDTHAAMVARWYTERAAGRPHPMVHGRNRERRILNALAQQILLADGVVDESHSVVLADGRRLCVGDQVVARHGDRSVRPAGDRDGWMRNGTTGQIVDIRSRTDGSPDAEIDISMVAGIITCGRGTFDRTDGGIDLAYAVTSHAVQGATNDVSTSAIGPSTNRSELYVDITRGRHENQLFATRAVTDVNADGAGLPRLDERTGARAPTTAVSVGGAHGTRPRPHRRAVGERRARPQSRRAPRSAGPGRGQSTPRHSNHSRRSRGAANRRTRAAGQHRPCPAAMSEESAPRRPMAGHRRRGCRLPRDRVASNETRSGCATRGDRVSTRCPRSVQMGRGRSVSPIDGRRNRPSKSCRSLQPARRPGHIASRKATARMARATHWISC